MAWRWRRRALLGLGSLLLIAVAAGFTMMALWLTRGEEAQAQVIRDYTLEIVPKDIEVAPGVIWHAWTYNGTVPGPTLEAKVGETLRVKVINRHNLTHSFHTHLTDYDLKYDGSQANTISGVGSGAMVPPGGEYVHEFQVNDPGLYYYHCHSADGGFMITQHIHNGLYGAIVVKAPEDVGQRDEVIFMSEIGHDVEVKNPGAVFPPYIMNGMGIPGGEHTLEEIFKEKGIEGVKAQFNKSVPVIFAKVGQPFRLHVVNIGDVIHSFHMHNVAHVSLDALQGRNWPANLLPLVPGAADTLLITPTKPGLWLFHCHVVQHADQGMIGVMVVDE